MIYRDPSQQLLKAYVSLLNDYITYAGEVITVGTRVPRKKTKYIQVYIESNDNYSTGDKMIYNITMALMIVVLQSPSEGDETPANDILEQVLAICGNPDSVIMKDFKCLTAIYDGSEYNTELTDTQYTITRKLRMSHFIEQNQ